MSKLLAALTLALATSFVVAPGFVSTADAKAKAKKAVMMTCKAKSAAGKKMSWKCAPGSKCCTNALTGEGTCGTSPVGCI